MRLLIVMIAAFIISHMRADYVVNGGFGLPALGAGILNGRFIDSWNVTWIDLKNELPYMGFGQYVDLQKGVSQNGWIEQYITLPFNGTYELKYYQRAKTTNYSLYRVQIYWNGVLSDTKVANTTNITYQSLILVGIAGINILKFQQTGLDVDNHGMNIDQVSLNLVTAFITNTTNATNSINSSMLNDLINSTNSSNMNNTQENKTRTLSDDQLYYISLVMSIFFNHAISIRYAFLLLQDLWLYSYDDRIYSGVIDQVFTTTSFIEELKFKVLDKYFGWMQSLQKLKLSDYKSYSRKTAKNSSQILLQVIFPYFIYTLPQTICICIAFFFGFHLLKTTKYGVFFRRYSFFCINLIQTLIEGNIAYFTFIFLGHLSLSFSFSIWDKASLLLSLLFFLAIFLFTFLFYLVAVNQLNIKAGYFISCFYRCISTYNFLTLNNILKGIARGGIFYFLSSKYQIQIMLLCLIQVFLILSSIILQKYKKIFMSKAIFSFYMLYQSLFFLLNICLLGQYQSQGQLYGIFLQLQGIIIYLLITVTVARMIIDFVPLQKFKIKNRKLQNELSLYQKNKKDSNLQIENREFQHKTIQTALTFNVNNNIPCNEQQKIKEYERFMTHFQQTKHIYKRLNVKKIKKTKQKSQS